MSDPAVSKSAGKKAALNVADQLRRAILESGLPVRQLCTEAGVPASGVYRFLKAERDLHFHSAVRLCARLGLHLVDRGMPSGGPRIAPRRSGAKGPGLFPGPAPASQEPS